MGFLTRWFPARQLPGTKPSISGGPFPGTPYFLWDNKNVRIVTFLAIGSLLLTTGGCTGETSGPSRGDTISREQFIEAYHELRREGLRSPSMEIGLEARDRILENLGLTEEDLLTFAEVWGSDPEVMQGLWEELDSLMRVDRMEGRGGPELDEDPADEPAIDFRGVGRS
jgi:hypothetical protein